MIRHVTVSTIVLALLPLTVSEARSQDRLHLSGLEINAHAGLAILDAPETNEFYAGGTAMLHFGSGLALGATVDWVGVTVEDVVEDADENASIWYYSGELSYGLPSVTQAQFYGFIGAGVAQTKPGDELSDAGVEDESYLMVPVGAGFRWLNDKLDPSWGANMEFRDRIVYVDEEETKVSNDWSISLGLSLILGG